MKLLKLILKISIGTVGLIALILIVLLNAESYEIIKTDHAIVEVKKIFWKKISECSVDSNGLYNGPATTWHLFSSNIRNEGQFKDGYWDGPWKDYDKDGQIIMVRVWNKGKLTKLFFPEGENLIEIKKENWPKYADIIQKNPQKIKEKNGYNKTLERDQAY